MMLIFHPLFFKLNSITAGDQKALLVSPDPDLVINVLGPQAFGRHFLLFWRNFSPVEVSAFPASPVDLILSAEISSCPTVSCLSVRSLCRMSRRSLCCVRCLCVFLGHFFFRGAPCSVHLFQPITSSQTRCFSRLRPSTCRTEGLQMRIFFHLDFFRFYVPLRRRVRRCDPPPRFMSPPLIVFRASVPPRPVAFFLECRCGLSTISAFSSKLPPLLSYGCVIASLLKRT